MPMAGSGEIEIDGETHPLEPGVMVRVGPDAKRKLVSFGDGMRVLAMGGVPGKVYEPSEVTELGKPDPLRPDHVNARRGARLMNLSSRMPRLLARLTRAGSGSRCGPASSVGRSASAPGGR